MSKNLKAQNRVVFGCVIACALVNCLLWLMATPLLYSLITKITEGPYIKPITSKHRLVDKSFLTGVPCEPPCWHGILVDKTSEDEAHAILSNLEFINYNSARSWDSDNIAETSAIETRFRCMYEKSRVCVSLTFDEGIVKSMWFKVSEDVTLDVAVEYLGPPEYVELHPWGPSGCSIDLVWPDKGIEVSHTIDYEYETCLLISEEGLIPRDLPAIRVSYASLDYYTEVHFHATDGYFATFPWVGFEE